MSAVFTIIVHGIPPIYQFEIDSNSELSIAGYDLDYEILMNSMGEPATDIIEVLNQFRMSPIKFIVMNWIPKYFKAPETFPSQDEINDILMWVAAGWVEHVLSVFEDEFTNDDGPKQAIEAVREYVKKNMDDINLLEKALENVVNSHGTAWLKMKLHPEHVASAATKVVRFAVEHSIGNETRSRIVDAHKLAASHGDDNDYDKESEWQLRFLVRTAECWQAKLPLPEIGDVP